MFRFESEITCNFRYQEQYKKWSLRNLMEWAGGQRNSGKSC